MIYRFTKKPEAVLDYEADWTAWLDNDAISSSSWVLPEGLSSTFETNTTTCAIVWLSGGEHGQDYKVTNIIETEQGRVDQRTMLLRVRTI